MADMKPRFFMIVAAIAMIAAPARAANDAVAPRIVSLNALVQTATKAYDTATLSRLITDDYTLISGDGHIWKRQAFLKDVADRSTTWVLNEPEDVTVHSYNDDCAIVVAILHLRFRMAGKVHDFRIRYTDVWVKIGGSWRYAVGQATSPLA